MAKIKRPEHDQEGERQKRGRGDNHIADRFEPQQKPVARFTHIVRAVEPDAQALDAARREEHGQCDANRERAVGAAGEHGVDRAGDRLGDFLRPGVEQDMRDLVGELLGAEECRPAT